MTNRLHAHIATSSTDCDGRIDNEYVMTMNDDEIAESKKTENDFSDIHFGERVLCSVANVYSLLSHGQLNVTRFEDGSTRITWNEPTDEGHRYAEALLCTDDCDEAEKSYRDHRAESMGY